MQDVRAFKIYPKSLFYENPYFRGEGRFDSIPKNTHVKSALLMRLLLFYEGMKGGRARPSTGSSGVLSGVLGVTRCVMTKRLNREPV